MKLTRIVLVLSVLLALGACSKFKTYHGPAVTRVVVQKSERKMYLLHYNKVLKSYDIELGFRPNGHKQFEGDGRTPEGRYYIDRRNPESQYHLSLGISYPRPVDVEVARDIGRSPGGDIFIHGKPKPYRKYVGDWTAGCIAISDKDIERVYSMVRDGTIIDIYP
ncbi:murein L,D-transpeptidase family protein [Pseudoruegeria sp. HB172150]|uniref:L,D-transpeptidase family protein n=1 Tax=Pseudoruegeria sp. HB172150 TaxID=2721164 RepID=UPI0015556B57|nr:L,D-transpeptidase family protein [Pseudoruegeria sp. HB172150]